MDNLSIRCVLLTILLAPFIAAAQKSELEGVPERIEGRIVDVTSVYAQRLWVVATDRAASVSYVARLPKERPWNFPYLRPQQRRFFPREEAPPSSVASAEILPQAPGRLLYALSLSDEGETTHGGLSVTGDAQDGGFTQDRGALNAVELVGRAGWTTERSAVRFRGVWDLRSSNWLRINRNDLTSPKQASKDRTLIVGELSGDHRPAMWGKTQVLWTLESSLYRLKHATTEDRITEANGSLALELDWMGTKPLRLRVSGSARETEGAFPAPETIATGVVEATLEDRYVSTGLGVLSWRGGVAAYRNPAENGAPGATAELAPSGRVALTTGSETGVGLRIEGGFSVEPFPTTSYSAEDYVVVNPRLRAQSERRAGLAAWWRGGGVAVGAEARVRTATDLPVWTELPDADGDDLIAWIPTNVSTQLIQGRAYLTLNPSARARIDAEALIERADAERLPYRPEWQGRVESAFELAEKLTLRIDGSWVGKRYNGFGPGARELEPYARLSGRLTHGLSDAVALFLAGEISVGEYRRFESSLPSALGVVDTFDGFYDLAQNAVGVGFSSRF